ncbi:MAG: HlyD family efflux transporter periplasmic adaptor subunit [Planctomycetia bacterium]|nr:HlyD family efflux transporter periplasmic adaptor subunit [Planctomycetia bacterium]
MIDALGMSDQGRVLPLRRRPDLKLVSSPHEDARNELVKDPVALRYYELREEEAFLLRQFDGSTSREEIRLRFESRFAPRRLDAEQLDRFIAQLFRQGLLITDRARQGAVLLERASEQKAERFRRRLLNPLAITLPGIDPRPILDRLMPLIGWIFTPAFVVFGIALGVAALAIALLRGEVLVAEIGTFAGSLSVDGLATAAIVIAGVKVVHELAHAAACRKFGGECREIGILLLVGIPSLYCDVTGTWMVRRRWQRVVVGAAGMMAELLLASISLLLWNGSEPGFFHSLCLQITVVCSVATVLFNGNPLLRYDGYFILSDFVGITNLGEQADAALQNRLSNWFFGPSPLDDERLLPPRRRAWLPWYAAISAIYKIIVTIGILWLLRPLLAPHGLTIVADLLAVAVMFSAVVVPTVRGAKRIRARVRNQQFDGRRFFVRAGGCAVVIGGLMLWPWTYRVSAPAIVRWEDARTILVTTPGRLVEAATEGAFVRHGATIAKLENLEIEREIVQLRGDLRLKTQMIEHLERRRVDDPAAGEQLPAAREVLEAVTRRLRLRETEASRLTITAPVDGFVLSLPAAQTQPELPKLDATADAVPDSYDSPLDRKRRGRYIGVGAALCAVGDAQHVEASLMVDERDIEFVRSGDPVRLQFDASGSAVLEGSVVEIAERTLEDAPAELLAAGRLPMDTDSTGKRRTTATYFQVRVRLDPAGPRPPLDAIGQAKIETAPQSFLRRSLRWLSGTFRLPAQEN